MKKNKAFKKAIAVAAATTMVITSSGMVFATDFTDIKDHWAKEDIVAWADKGVVKGYPDESFKPGNSITRAEFMSLIDKAFELIEEEEIDYPDVDEDAWYYDLVKRAEARGYIGGYEDGTMRPQDPISRQEAAAIVTRIRELQKDTEKVEQFLDHEKFQEWSQGYIGAVAKAGYMTGDDKGNFRATDNITRAEAVRVLNNIFYGEDQGDDNGGETTPVEAKYGFIIEGDSYTEGALVDPTDEDFEGKEAITIKLEKTEEGTAFEGKVRIAAVEAEGVQLWAKDSSGNWYDINQIGWGPAEGFDINLDVETEVYVFVAEDVTENITVSFKLVSVEDAAEVIAEGTKVIAVESNEEDDNASDDEGSEDTDENTSDDGTDEGTSEEGGDDTGNSNDDAPGEEDDNDGVTDGDASEDDEKEGDDPSNDD